MLRSLYSGVSGLRSHQTDMDVIGNNISNVNTHGYKKGRTTFKDLLSQTLSGASGAQNGRGGINPQQVGLGTQIGSIDNDHSQGSLQTTNVESDMALEGDGYFIVSDGDQDLYTRNGNFTLDEEGSLVAAGSGQRLQGWQAEDGEINRGTTIDDIQIPVGDRINGEASTEVEFGGNLDSETESGATETATIDIYDSQGKSHTLIMNFEKEDNNQWDWENIEIAGVDEGDYSINLEDGDYDLLFNDSGEIETGETATISIDDFPDGAYLGDEDDNEITIDFSAITQQSSETSVSGIEADGFEAGELDSYSIDDTGVIIGSYTNGLTRSLGQVAVANFSNPEGLSKEGETIFTDSENSGSAMIGVAGSGGRGSISSGTLEESNVDLAEEFSEMITTQRGFQANSRTISTSDEILQELVNLRR